MPVQHVIDSDATFTLLEVKKNMNTTGRGNHKIILFLVLAHYIVSLIEAAWWKKVASLKYHYYLCTFIYALGNLEQEKLIMLPVRANNNNDTGKG